MAVMGLFTALTALGSFIRIPFFPVPLTGQSFFPLLAGCFFSPLAAAITQIGYLLMGIAGLPVFSQGGGLPYVMHPTFGYLLAMPVVAALVALFIRHYALTLSFNRILFITFICAILLLVIGALWMYTVFALTSAITMPLTKALWLGVFLFLPAELFKAVIASFLAVKLRHRIKI